MRRCCECRCLDKRICKICKTCTIPGPAGRDGVTPEIGENGNWWIGNTDTGIAAKGEKGDKGDPGDPSTANILYLQAQSQKHAGEAVSVIPFDTTKFDNSNGVIEITPDNNIVFNSPGLYKIDYQLSYDDPNLGDGDLWVDYIYNNGTLSRTSYHSNTGFISGSLVLDLHTPGVTFPFISRFNFMNAGHPVPLGSTSIQTNVTILKLS